ncbi:MAG: outer membrane beta-barrel protein [Alphaproteobacteria bacterium]|nr:outer membrane beta-barrel protein [Alphaproteobacteria bacterium]
MKHLKTNAAVGALIAAISVGLATNATAQNPQRGVEVGDRSRNSYDPIGVRLGSFKLFPKLSISEDYDDNIFSEETNTSDDFITKITPELSLQSDWNNHQLNLDVSAEVGSYASNSAENYTNLNTSVDGRIDIKRDTTARFNAGYSFLHEERGSPDNVNGIDPTDYTLFNPGIGLTQRFNRAVIDLDATLSIYAYDDVLTSSGTIINNDDRDRTRNEVSARLGYELVRDFEAFARVSYNTVDYDDGTDDSGFNRNSDGYEIVAGTTLDFGGKLFGNVFAGYRSQSVDDVSLAAIEGPTFGGALTWNATSLTTANTSINRSVRETTQLNSGGYFATSYNLSVDHELKRNILLNASFNYTLNDYEGITREDDLITAGISARYLMSRHLYLSLSFEHATRDSTVVGSDYDKNTASLRLETQF